MNTKPIVPSLLLNNPFDNFPMVECLGNEMKINSQAFEVTEKHKRLVICLLNDITLKNDIINIVWYEQAGMVSDNNYHQLIHKFRNLLSEHQLPKAMLKTIPRHGVMLDFSVLPPVQAREISGNTLLIKKSITFSAIASLFTATLAMISKTINR